MHSECKPRWTHVLQPTPFNSQGTPSVKTLKDQKTGSPAQVQQVCRFWKSEGGCTQPMKTASTTAIPAGQHPTRSRTAPITLRLRMTKAKLRLELQRGLQPMGVGPVVVMVKALGNKEREVPKEKVEKMPTKRTRRAIQQDQKMIKRM